MPVRSYEKDIDVFMEINVERNLDQVVIAREGYTILDYLSDIGGMQGMIFSGFALLLSFWNHNYFDDHLVSRLYKFERPIRTTSTKIEKLTDVGRIEEMSTHRLDNPKACFRDLLPTCLCQLS